ncbi:protein of unknown function (plasmid) [Methylocella tundrae]|uniref:Uncharacterized protein n=1 Tax=Methylocella tundrae TaxID=227605 RepID=A0A4U8Z897_METTU|nr:protein of unknown function [Methylocella tundrae]
MERPRARAQDGALKLSPAPAGMCKDSDRDAGQGVPFAVTLAPWRRQRRLSASGQAADGNRPASGPFRPSAKGCDL